MLICNFHLKSVALEVGKFVQPVNLGDRKWYPKWTERKYVGQILMWIIYFCMWTQIWSHLIYLIFLLNFVKNQKFWQKYYPDKTCWQKEKYLFKYIRLSSFLFVFCFFPSPISNTIIICRVYFCDPDPVNIILSKFNPWNLILQPLS